MTMRPLGLGRYARPVSRWWPYMLLAVILLCAALVRMAFLHIIPTWYPDEGSDIEVATHLMTGEQRHFAIGQSTMIVARPPLFHLLLALLFSLFGRDIVVLRMLTAAYGVLTVFFLYFWGRHMWGSGVALLAAALYAIYPNAVLYSRFGFLYNQVAFLHLLLFYALWRYVAGRRNGWLVVACLSLGLSLVTGVSSLPMAGFLIITLVFTQPSRLWWAVPLTGLVPLLYGAWMLTASPDAFLYDLGFIFSRLGGDLLVKVVLAVWNYMRLLHWDAWFVLAAFGMTRLQDSQNRLFTNLFFWYALFTTVTGVPGVAGLGYHYVIPLLPWVAVGVAAFLIWAFPRLLASLQVLYERLYARLPWSTSQSRWNSLLRRQGRLWMVALTLFWILLSPFLVAATQAFYPPAAVERVTIPNIADARSVAAYVNHHVAPDDVVLAPPHVGWLLDAKVADFQQSAAYVGGETQNYPDNMDRGRFLFDCSVHNARYAVLWDDWKEWAGTEMPDVDEVFQIVEEWPVAYQEGDMRVYINPEAQD